MKTITETLRDQFLASRVTVEQELSNILQQEIWREHIAETLGVPSDCVPNHLCNDVAFPVIQIRAARDGYPEPEFSDCSVSFSLLKRGMSEMKTWWTDNLNTAPQLAFDWSTCVATLVFESKEDATLFRLRWF